MSCCKELEIYKKTLNLMKKESQFLKKDIVIYREEKNQQDFETQMINGYLEMANINLEIARIGEVDMADAFEYEAWLYGVWYFKWRQW